MKSTPTVRRVNSDLIGRSFISLGIQKRGPGDNATTRDVKKRSYYHRDVYRSTESNYSATYDSLEKAGADLCRYARKHMIRQRRNKATHLPHNNTSRHLSNTPCRNHLFSAVGAADYTTKGSAGRYSISVLEENFGRTHKLPAAEAVADSRAGQHSPGRTVAAAAGSNLVLDQAVALSADTSVNDTAALTTLCGISHLQGDNIAAVAVDRNNLCWTLG
jgi:hypothetical protein